MRSQPLLYVVKIEKSLFLVFEVASNIMICSLKPLSVQQFVENFHLGIQNSVYYDHIRPQPQFHAAVRKQPAASSLCNCPVSIKSSCSLYN